MSVKIGQRVYAVDDKRARIVPTVVTELKYATDGSEQFGTLFYPD